MPASGLSGVVHPTTGSIMIPMPRLGPLLAACALLLLRSPALAQVPTSGPWVLQNSTSTASLRGIHVVGGGIAWASGSHGTVLRTEDGGYMWQSCSMPPGADQLDFRAIWAFGDDTALIMSSGPGDQSRLYRTTDGCSHWKLLSTNSAPDGFWDALTFDSAEHGLLLGDPVHDHFVLLETHDGGLTWTPLQQPGLETRPNGAGAFAASNSSLVDHPGTPLAFGTTGGWVYVQSWLGAGSQPEPPGNAAQLQPQWTSFATPLSTAGPSAGVFSLAFRPASAGHPALLMAVGGDYTQPGNPTGTAAWSSDGGMHWTAATQPPHGYRSSVEWDADDHVWIAAGTNGSDLSRDDGKTWQPLDNGNWNALSLPWIVGPSGRIGKLDASKLPH